MLRRNDFTLRRNDFILVAVDFKLRRLQFQLALLALHLFHACLDAGAHLTSRNQHRRFRLRGFGAAHPDYRRKKTC
jgi:hypothetical protein